MSAEKIIRTQAREKLKNGGWTKALIGLGVILIFFTLLDCVASVEYILTGSLNLTKMQSEIVSIACRSAVIAVAFLLSPAILGYFRMLSTDEKEYDMSDVVYYFLNFERYSKAVTFVFSFVLRMISPTLLWFILPAIEFVIDNFIFPDALNDTVYSITFWLLVVMSALQVLRYSLRYIAGFLLFFKDESKKCSYYFATSKKIMSCNDKKTFKLILSYTPWILLCITILPMMYVLPYMTQALCISTKWIIQLQGMD